MRAGFSDDILAAIRLPKSALSFAKLVNASLTDIMELSIAYVATKQKRLGVCASAGGVLYFVSITGAQAIVIDRRAVCYSFQKSLYHRDDVPLHSFDKSIYEMTADTPREPEYYAKTLVPACIAEAERIFNQCISL